MKRSTILLAAAMLTASCFGSKHVESITVQNGNVYYYMPDIEKPFSMLFLADTHFTVEDVRGRDFHDYTARMGGAAVEPANYGKTNGHDKALGASLAKAQQCGAELVVLGGDIINFPSLASVEHLREMLDTAAVNWVYTAGNHDWHYEGEPGIDFDQRQKWTGSAMAPLYHPGDNPMYLSRQIGGINVVAIDNSLFEITPAQLEFFKKELTRGLPVILCLHIPLYTPGHNIDYGCGSPEWNKSTDCYYEIERRLPWPENGCSDLTREFHHLAINSPEVIGIYAGHTHEEAVDFINDRIQFVVDANYNHKDVIIHFIPCTPAKD